MARSSLSQRRQLCEVCDRSCFVLFGTKQCNIAGTWTDKPCTYLRKDMLQRHKISKIHQDAKAHEAERLASQSDGGITQAFSAHVMINRKALIGALQMMYWLAKEEIAHPTKFASLMDLSTTLRSGYPKELNLGINSHYTSQPLESYSSAFPL